MACKNVKTSYKRMTAAAAARTTKTTQRIIFVTVSRN